MVGVSIDVYGTHTYNYTAVFLFRPGSYHLLNLKNCFRSLDYVRVRINRMVNCSCSNFRRSMVRSRGVRILRVNTVKGTCLVRRSGVRILYVNFIRYTTLTRDCY